jgi:cephalosporin hydroxylase
MNVTPDQRSLVERARGRARRSLRDAAQRVDARLSTDAERTDAAVTAFRSLPTELIRDDVIDRFHELYYNAGHERTGTWWQTSWLGRDIWKCPLDVWLYQEIIYEIRPDLIIETGTAYGGSASYLGAICDLVGNGSIVSVDIDPKPDLPQHDRVRYITSSSTDASVVSELAELAGAADTVVVILDSDHSAAHVTGELAAYAPLVTPGSFLIVEDTNVNGHPVLPDFGPGPMEAMDAFLAAHPEFVIDERSHKFLMTFNPRGILRRVA